MERGQGIPSAQPPKCQHKIRMYIYTTNATEWFSSQLRKVTKAQLACRCYAACQTHNKKIDLALRADYSKIHARCSIYFGDTESKIRERALAPRKSPNPDIVDSRLAVTVIVARCRDKKHP